MKETVIIDTPQMKVVEFENGFTDVYLKDTNPNRVIRIETSKLRDILIDLYKERSTAKSAKSYLN